MKKGIAIAAFAVVGLVAGLLPNSAQGLQYGATVGYSSVGFQLHGGSVELLLGIGGKDGHRPQGSVIHVGFAGATGEGETDLTKATFDGIEFTSLPALNRLGILQGLGAYGITDAAKAKGDGTAYIISAAYEYVFSKGAPGLGIIGGAELYISQGGFESLSPLAPSLETEGGIGGGAVIGVSYYLRSGINFSFKTGLGAVDPGKIEFAVGTASTEIQPATVFYASPTFSIGYIY